MRDTNEFQDNTIIHTLRTNSESKQNYKIVCVITSGCALSDGPFQLPPTRHEICWLWSFSLSYFRTYNRPKARADSLLALSTIPENTLMRDVIYTTKSKTWGDFKLFLQLTTNYQARYSTEIVLFTWLQWTDEYKNFDSGVSRLPHVITLYQLLYWAFTRV